MICQIAFWTSVALVAYTFAGYQVVIGVLACFCRPCRGLGVRHPVTGGLRPRLLSGSPSGTHQEGLYAASERVAAVIVACNEEGRIRARVENLLAAGMALDVVVCSDGSTDGTAAQARLAGARVLEFPTRRGKAACLSDAIPALDSRVVVLTDARQQFTRETIPRLVRHFADPGIGAVSGILRIGGAGTSTGAGVDLYWKMETAVRQSESDFDSCIGCTGAVYAIRRELFTPIPADTILDDIVIPMGIALAGYRVVYDNEAEAFDPQPLDPGTEARRKTRTLAGNFQMLARHPAWLLPWKNRVAWQLVSHKYLRLAGPLFLACILVSSAGLARIPFYRGCLGLQILLYLLACAGLAFPALRMRLFSIPAGFVFLNLMTLRGFFRFLFGSKRGGWERAVPVAQEPG